MVDHVRNIMVDHVRNIMVDHVRNIMVDPVFYMITSHNAFPSIFAGLFYDFLCKVNETGKMFNLL